MWNMVHKILIYVKHWVTVKNRGIKKNQTKFNWKMLLSISHLMLLRSVRLRCTIVQLYDLICVMLFKNNEDKLLFLVFLHLSSVTLCSMLLFRCVMRSVLDFNTCKFMQVV